MNIGVDSRSLGPLKTGVGTYLSQVLDHWPADQLDSFLLFSHQSIGYRETPTVRHCVADAQLGLAWYLLRSRSLVSRSPLALFWGTQGLLPLRLPNTLPAVITIHDCTHQHGIRYAPSAPYNWVHRCLLPSAVRRARRILVVSRFVADEVMRTLRLPASKIEVTPLGVRPEFFSRVQKESHDEAGLKHESDKLNRQNAVLEKYQIKMPFILGVGTIEPRKNLRTLLEAFARIPSRLQNRFQLLLAGKPGWGTDELHSYLKSYAYRDRLILTGYVPEDDLRTLYSCAEMFVFPSFYEGFGLPVVEALASGCPVIASTAGALREVTGSAAILVGPNDPPEEWARAMVRIAESPELRRSLALAGPEQARQYSWESCAQKTSEVFRDVVRGTR